MSKIASLSRAKLSAVFCLPVAAAARRAPPPTTPDTAGARPPVTPLTPAPKSASSSTPEGVVASLLPAPAMAPVVAPAFNASAIRIGTVTAVLPARPIIVGAPPTISVKNELIG